jgi:predicted transcriptional regulator
MGAVSNLITDMTIKGATEAEIVRAVKHSMVVIDAEKHQLNWKQSEIDQNIKQLKEKYQSKPTSKGTGASTIISQAKSPVNVLLRSQRTGIDPDTGEKVYYTSKDAVWYDKEGNRHERTEESTKMAEAKDAYELVSRDASGVTTQIEMIYADYANQQKALANEIRKEILRTPNGKINNSAREEFAAEIKSLEDKVRFAELNAPNERLAQAAASVYIASKKKERAMSKDDENKMRAQVIKATREKAGALPSSKRAIVPTDGEWEAIIAGGLSTAKVNKILGFMDSEEVLRRTMPRDRTELSATKKARARSMLKAGYTWTDVADAIGVSESTLRKYL